MNGKLFIAIPAGLVASAASFMALGFLLLLLLQLIPLDPLVFLALPALASAFIYDATVEKIAKSGYKRSILVSGLIIGTLWVVSAFTPEFQIRVLITGIVWTAAVIWLSRRK